MINKFFKSLLIFFIILGISFSNIPFYALTGLIDSYEKTSGIVDKMWLMEQNHNSDVVDKFESIRNVAEKIKIYNAMAAVANDAASESHTSTTGSTNAASFSWTHTPAGTPRGVIVFVTTISATKKVTGVTYGGVAMTEITGGAAVDTAGEPGRIDTFFLGASVPTGAQTIVVSRTNDATIMYAAAATQTAGANTEVYLPGIVLLQNNGTFAVQSVTDGSTGVNSVRYAAGYSGGSSVLPAGTGSTVLNSIDFGVYTQTFARETTAGQGARNVGFNYTTSDDRAGVHLAVRENTTPTLTVTQPDGTGDTVTVGDLYNITYNLADAENVVTVAMYYDTDATGLNGTAITGACATAAEGTGATCSWDTTGMTPGNYYVYGTTTDGVNPEVTDYSPGVITINAPAYTLTVGATGIQTVSVDSGTTTAAYLGGAFTFVLDSGSATLDSFIISEMGSTTANTSLTSVDIQTDTDGAYPGSTVTGCTGLTFNASQKLTCTPSGGLSLSSATTRYVYVVVNTISSGAAGGETIEIEITNAATEVSVTGATNGSSGTKAITGATTIRPYISSITYPRTSPQNGGEIGQSVTINGAGFGTSCNGASNKVEIASAIISCTGTTFSATSISITDFQYSSGDSYGGTGASGLLVTVGNATSSARQTFYVYPSITGVSVSEAREGDTVATISGNHFGTAEGANGVKFDDGTERTATVNGTWSATSITNVVVPTAISDSVDTVTIKIYQGTGGNNSLYGTSTTFTILPDITDVTNPTAYTNAAREYDAADSDGIITVNGNHFGAAGTINVSVGGSNTATQVTTATCAGSAYQATCVGIQIPTTVPNNSYSGSIVLTRTSGSKTDTYGGGTFRILPRIIDFTPASASVGDSATVNGNHFCQNGGACPGAFDATDNYVIFNSNATATAFISWSDTAMATEVPTGASTGNVFLRSNGYNSNAKSFTVNVPTPADPINHKQSRNSGFTNLISLGEYASSTPVYFSVDTSSGITGGTMYLQTELRLTGSAFTSSCSGNPYCFESGGSAYSGGTITLTTSTTTPTTTLDDNYHWQARVCYNKNGTHNISCTGTGDNPSNNWISFGTDPDDVNEVDFKMDITAPTISIGSVTPGQNGATIPWDTNELATSQVEYGTDSGLSGSSFTAVTDTPPATSGKTSGHSVVLSNLNCNTTYYFRTISKNKAYIEATSTISSFPTSGCPTKPAKTTTFHIKGATGIISGDTTSTTTFAVIMPETATTTKNAFIEVMGVYLAGASSKDIGIQVNSQSARTYVVPASTTSFFKFIYQVDSVNSSNTLVITPQANTSVYISSARIIVTYEYTP